MKRREKFEQVTAWSFGELFWFKCVKRHGNLIRISPESSSIGHSKESQEFHLLISNLKSPEISQRFAELMKRRVISKLKKLHLIAAKNV